MRLLNELWKRANSWPRLESFRNDMMRSTKEKKKKKHPPTTTTSLNTCLSDPRWERGGGVGGDSTGSYGLQQTLSHIFLAPI